ncbi:MAG: PQQ-binding-like beta-propeller repeat protein [Actinopolymorphaceae bacterium]
MNWFRAIAIGLLATTVLGGCAGRPDVRVEHRTIDTAPDPLSDDGPPLAAYGRAWRTTVTVDSGVPIYHLAGGHLMVVSEEAIEAYDARTGKPSWHYREPGREIDGFAATEGVIVAGFQTASDNTAERHTFGLDAGTGELLWENTKDWNLTHDGEGTVYRPQEQADAADGVVAISTHDDEERIGVEARTGDEVWKLTAGDTADSECDPPEEVQPTDDPAEVSVLPVRFECERDFTSDNSDEMLLAVDPGSGEPRWGRRLRSSVDLGSPTVRVRGGTTLVEPAGEHTTPELIGPNGRTLFKLKSGFCSVECGLYASDGWAALAYAEETGQAAGGTATLAAVDLESGRTSRMPDPGRSRATYLTAAGKLYGLTTTYGWEPSVEATDRLAPTGMTVVDVATKRVDDAPMPYPTHVLFSSPDGKVEEPVAVGGERWFTARQVLAPDVPADGHRAEVSSYAPERTSGPPELAGVSPEDWSDPCALLAKIPRGYHDTEPPEPAPALDLGDVRIRTMCSRYDVTVRINWVAGTEQEAKRLFPDGKPSTVGADEERESADDTSMLYRVGRTIMQVDTLYGEQEDTIIRQIVRSLREGPTT